MPGPISHIMYGFGIGWALRIASEGRFSDKHMLVFGLGCFWGPDVGPFVEFVLKEFFNSETLSFYAMKYFHHDFWFPALWAPLMAFPYQFLTSLELYQEGHQADYNRLGTIFRKIGLQQGIPLLYSQTWALCVAGGLSHFYFDTVFEMNGKEPKYLWILSTGYWKDAYLDPFAMFCIAILTMILVFGFWYVNKKPGNVNFMDLDKYATQQELIKTNRSLVLFVFVLISYVFYLWFRTYGPFVTEKIPVAGEEADLGVIVFMTCYFLLPLYLCVYSMDPSKDNSKNEFTL